MPGRMIAKLRVSNNDSHYAAGSEGDGWVWFYFLNEVEVHYIQPAKGPTKGNTFVTIPRIVLSTLSTQSCVEMYSFVNIFSNP